ncbi:MAG: GAF domain-containing protein [Microcoleus vaginatus WJT46-NPBG5]|jgi:signal transduction histidine kinase|nr:GAF domain-containing protein [Microcoleus vaginatus WJT46-NPBG5]
MSFKIYAPSCPWPLSDSYLPEGNKSVSQDPSSLTENTEDQDIQTLQLKQQVQMSALLNEINNSVRSTLDLEEILTSACRLLGQALKCSRVSILVNELEEAETFITRGEYNQGDYLVQLGLKVPIADNPHLKILVSQPGPLAVTNFQEFPGLGEGTRELVKKLGIRSMLAIATRYQGKVNGVIGLQQCDRERQWTKWEQQLLEGVASQLAIAINQAQLYSESRRQAERESLLRLVTNQIRSTLDLNTILQTAVRGVRQILNSDRVVIYQFKENWHGEIVVEDLIVPWPSIFRDMVADNCFSEEYAHLYQQGRVRSIPDIHKAGLNPCHVKYLESLQVQANLIVPIVMGRSEQTCEKSSANHEPAQDLNNPEKPPLPNRLWGLLIAHECSNPRNWQPSEIELLSDLADQIAISIQQAQLYAQVQETAAKSQAQAQQLQATLEELRSTQMQLIQSVKLSSLGQMVAGIAHEMNNANNVILANLHHAQEYAGVLSQAINVVADLCPDSSATVDRLNAELELDYIQQDFPQLLKSMQQGSERIRTIVLTLRNFSRLDEAESKVVNLNEGVESSLAMLQHRLKERVTIHKEYGNLPPVECCAGQINQVFFNLLNNALDAVEAKSQLGELTIRTWQSAPDWVAISIRDNGAGIAVDIQERIFDPFFTTKPIGQGTGLGLSMCYQVIVKGHGGRLCCISSPDEGAEFIVELPVKAKGEGQ